MYMENRQNGQRPPVRYENRFLRVWGPLLIKWGIGILVSLMATMVFTGAYAAANTEEFLAAAENQDAMMKIVYRITEIAQRYTTEIAGVEALITIPIMCFLFHRDRKREKAYGIAPAKKAPASRYILVVLMACTLNLAMNNLIIIGNLSSYSASYEDTATALYSAPLGMQILCLGFLTPIAEEMVFRGLMYRRMREDTKFVMAMIYSAVIFGLFHGNLVQIIYGTVMGLMLAYVYEKYGSVLAPITAHVAANLLSILATYFEVYRWMSSNILIIGGITVACATAAACVFLAIQQMGGETHGGQQDGPQDEKKGNFWRNLN